MEKIKYEFSDLNISQLSKDYSIINFDCGERNLNGFLREESFIYHKNGIARTNIVTCNEIVVGFFSLCADSIKLMDYEKKGCNLSDKPISEWPSVKIARLAVDKRFQNKNIGKHILSFIVGLVRNYISRDIGCRFITVDSYPGKIGFYGLKGFKENEHRIYTKKQDFISMRFDLLNQSQA